MNKKSNPIKYIKWTIFTHSKRANGFFLIVFCESLVSLYTNESSEKLPSSKSPSSSSSLSRSFWSSLISASVTKLNILIEMYSTIYRFNIDSRKIYFIIQEIILNQPPFLAGNSVLLFSWISYCVFDLSFTGVS